MAALAACYAEPPPTPPPTCAEVADVLRARSAARETDGSVLAQTRDVFAQRCADDAWPTVVLACIVGEREGENRHCKDKLTDPQRAALDGALAKLVITPEQYRAVIIRGSEAMIDVMHGDDCAKVEADLQAYSRRARRELDSAAAWKDAHPDEARTIELEVRRSLWAKLMGPMQTALKCQDDPAFKRVKNGTPVRPAIRW